MKVNEIEVIMKKKNGEQPMELTYHKVSEFERGLLYKLLIDAYSCDNRWRERFEKDWKEFDDFFFDNLEIADQYGFVTVLGDRPIGHISWDPRNRPEYVEIGHNCIATEFKGNGYGKSQLSEALHRICEYPDVKKIIVHTNGNLVAPHNYESVGFRQFNSRKCEEKDSFMGDYLDYQIQLMND
jgi:RimJ/RimL family protein N-acetyltransferase